MKVDLRCPVTPRRLFARVLAGDTHVTSDNLIEFACSDCRNANRKMGQPCVLVLHRFNLLGQIVDTEIVTSG